MPHDQDWFIRERSEALATVLLTSRDDIRVHSQREVDQGADLFVELKDPGEQVSTKLFVVQVRGTTSNPKVWMRSVKQLFKSSSYYHLPACVFVIDVRDNNNAQYAWLAEPQVEGESATLNFFEEGTFRPLNEQAVDDIVGLVQQWYAAMPRVAVAHSK